MTRSITKRMLPVVALFATCALLQAQAVAPKDAPVPPAAATPKPPMPLPPIAHPALFLVGDSIMQTGKGDGSTGPWGWGTEIIPMFDPAKIHVYNAARGGRSSRGYIQEGAWQLVLDQLQPGDWVILEFGNNDSANSANYPDRTTLPGNGDGTQDIDSPVTHQKETLHSYGWYMREYVREAKAKGAEVIICSPPPRNTWVYGKVLRGMNGYAEWAQEAAEQSDAYFIDLNTLSADKYDALGQATAQTYFNDDQHSKKIGAHMNAESVVTGIRGLKFCPLANDLAPAAAQ